MTFREIARLLTKLTRRRAPQHSGECRPAVGMRYARSITSHHTRGYFRLALSLNLPPWGALPPQPKPHLC